MMIEVCRWRILESDGYHAFNVVFTLNELVSVRTSGNGLFATLGTKLLGNLWRAVRATHSSVTA